MNKLWTGLHVLKMAFIVFFLHFVNSPLGWCQEQGVEMSTSRPRTKEEFSSLIQKHVKLISEADIELEIIQIRTSEDGSVDELKYDSRLVGVPGACRLTYAMESKRDGKLFTYEIEDFLFKDTNVLVWNHSGYPGRIQFGTEGKNETDKLLQDASRFVDFRRPFRDVVRLLTAPSATITQETEDLTVITVIPPSQAAESVANTPRLDIVFEKQYDWLPTSAKRMEQTSEQYSFMQGTGLEFKYKPERIGELHSIIPTKIVKSKPLKPGASGTTLVEWTLKSIKPTESPSQVKLAVPITSDCDDLDADKKKDLSDIENKNALISKFGGYLEILDSVEAVVWMRDNTKGGKSPAIPSSFMDRAEAIVKGRYGVEKSRFSTYVVLGLCLALAGAVFVWRKFGVAVK